MQIHSCPETVAGTSRIKRYHCCKTMHHVIARLTLAFVWRISGGSLVLVSMNSSSKGLSSPGVSGTTPDSMDASVKGLPVKPARR